ncbi:DUF2750 domain-containing protein [Acinetobacter sp. SwsAc6]|jgi:hypothetical protein|uniref:DUF2750 domain-containing protein n=1 Tax=Acinetobacter sp. SwsAc6 TaxID=2749439 RepID=UPI0015BCC5C5|nr:DUF2750 domain-containing protein [Acinetobacter sp. SwsAc6]NWK76194.1 DUF2750 domain-containing protein [Acinetobacter sp. SwsAc6]
MLNLSQKQIQAVLKLPAPEKYSHFIKETVGSDEIWTLYKGELYDGNLEDSPMEGEYAYLQDDNSNLFLPLWPAEVYADLCRVNSWEKFQPIWMGIEQFIDEYLPHFLERNIKFCIFPTVDDTGVIPTVEQFVRDLNTELSLYE